MCECAIAQVTRFANKNVYYSFDQGKGFWGEMVFDVMNRWDTRWTGYGLFAKKNNL